MKFAGPSRLAFLVISSVLICYVGFGLAQNVKSRGHRKILGGSTVPYPKIAEEVHLEGTVRVKITVAPDGTVVKTELIGGSPVFVGPTLDALKSMKWQPAAEETIELVEIEFRLQHK